MAFVSTFITVAGEEVRHRTLKAQQNIWDCSAEPGSREPISVRLSSRVTGGGALSANCVVAQ